MREAALNGKPSSEPPGVIWSLQRCPQVQDLTQIQGFSSQQQPVTEDTSQQHRSPQPPTHFLPGKMADGELLLHLPTDSGEPAADGTVTWKTHRRLQLETGDAGWPQRAERQTAFCLHAGRLKASPAAQGGTGNARPWGSSRGQHSPVQPPRPRREVPGAQPGPRGAALEASVNAATQTASNGWAGFFGSA